MSADRERLRATFEQVPEQYERARPSYPAELFDDLVALAGLSPGAAVLEVGCGTGQATRPLAERGLEVVCIELGAELAAFARRKMAGFPNVEIVNADFEAWVPTRTFDAVASFSAFHWIDPARRYELAASALREGGALAVAGTRHVLLDGGDPFWREVQEDYDAVVPHPDNRPPPHPDELRDLREEFEASGLFRDFEARRYLFDVTYDADAYIDVIGTYSPNLALEEATRRRLFERIHRRIAARPGGTVTKTYVAFLNVARRG